MSRIRDRCGKRGPRHGGPKPEPVLHVGGRTFKPFPTGTYFIPAGTFRVGRKFRLQAKATLSDAPAKGKSFTIRTNT